MPTSRQLVTTIVKPFLAAIVLAGAVGAGPAIASLTDQPGALAGCPMDTHWSEEQQICVADTHW